MANKLLTILKRNKIKIEVILDDINKRYQNVENLTNDEIIQLKKDIDEAKNSIYPIQIMNQKILSKIKIQIAIRTPSIKKDMKDSKSYNYNNILASKNKPAQAVYSVEELARKGDVKSQLLIGKTYLNGVIGFYGDIKMRDVGLGLKWLTVAYKAGSLEAGFLIATYEKSVLNTKNAIIILERLRQDSYRPAIKELMKIYKDDIRNENMSKYLELKMEMEMD